MALAPHNGTTNKSQLVQYDAGVGTDGSTLSRIAGGAFGLGIDSNIQQLYSFLALNYTPADDVVLVGFSRGAYTVRSLAGLINYAGLVRAEELGFVNEAYELYRSDQGGPDGVKAVEFRKAHGDRIPIKVVACFDTVGSLGLPTDYLRNEGVYLPNSRYAFHDTALNPMVEHGIHILSTDEDNAGTFYIH